MFKGTFSLFKMFICFERQREREQACGQGRGRERGRERIQAGSVLLAQTPMGAQSHEP